VSQRRKSRALGLPTEEHSAEADKLFQVANNARDDGEQRLQAGDCREAFRKVLDSQKWLSEGIAHLHSTPRRMDNEVYAKSVRALAAKFRDDFNERCVLVKPKRGR